MMLFFSKKHTNIILSFILVFVFLLSIPTQVKAETTNFTRTSFSNSEPDNYLRGYYRWQGSEVIPNMHNGGVVYKRIEWSKIETAEGVYNFAEIDNGIADARSKGAKFAFRLRDLTSGSTSTPLYLVQVGAIFQT